jgi:hypothetical protein
MNKLMLSRQEQLFVVVEPLCPRALYRVIQGFEERSVATLSRNEGFGVSLGLYLA